MEQAVAADADTDPDGFDVDLELRRPAPQSWRARTAIEMIVSGCLGLYASFTLSIEAWRLAADSQTTFACDISEVLSCSAVAMTPQARVLGFPNAFLGIAFESVVLAVSVGMLAGVRFPRWYMRCVEALYTVALAFALWLFMQSYFVIHVLCPWCLLVTLTTTLVWAGLTRINIRDSALPAPASWRRFIQAGTDWTLTGLVLVVLLAMVALRYGTALLG
jgi:uncharacterized membrane protein